MVKSGVGSQRAAIMRPAATCRTVRACNQSIYKLAEPASAGIKRLSNCWQRRGSEARGQGLAAQGTRQGLARARALSRLTGHS